MTRRGLALLEVMVALVILSLVVLGYLQLLRATHQAVAGSREWSDAAAHAADGMERAKLELPRLPTGAAEPLADGFERRVAAQSWRPGLTLLTVTVKLPAGGQLEVHRLARADPGAPR
jgi:prepilin-type N-terminal cleavage/methylation domain-containing protein